MVKHRTHKRRRKSRRSSCIVPRQVAKGVRDINKITRRVARGIDKYPLKAVRGLAGVVLKPRKMPRLKIGGYDSKAVRQLRNPGVFGAAAKTAKKGGALFSGKKKKKRAWDASDVALGVFAAPLEGARLALGKGGRKSRRGGKRSRRGGKRRRRGGRRTHRRR